MKNNLLKGALFVALAGLITFTGCKYEDGPGISLRSKRDRFSNEWIVKSYMRDTVNLSEMFTDSNNIDSGNIAFITTRTGHFEFHIIPNIPHHVYWDSEVWSDPTYLKMKELTSNLSEAMGMKTSYSNDTPEFSAPKGSWTFDDKSSTVQLGQGELEYIDTIPNIKYDIVELREDALKLKWVDEAKVTRTIGFEPLNDEDFFL